MKAFLWLACIVLLFFVGTVVAADTPEGAKDDKVEKAIKRAEALADERQYLERDLVAFLEEARLKGIPATLEWESPEARAMDALGALRPTFRDAPPALIRWLTVRYPTDPDKRSTFLGQSPAGRALVGCGNGAVPPLLEHLAKCEEGRQCDLVIETLRVINGPDITVLLLKDLRDKKKSTSEQAKTAIERFLEKPDRIYRVPRDE